MTFPIILIIVAAAFIYGGIKNYNISDLFIGKLTKNADNTGGSDSGDSAASGTPPPLSGGNPVLSNPVVAAAKKYLGVPYLFGGNNPLIGIDCSRFVQLAFQSVGINLKRTTYDQFKQGSSVDISEIQPGDVVFTVPTFKGPDHEGLYVGNGLIQESPHTSTGPQDIEVNKYIPLKSFLSGGLVGVRRFS